LILVLFPKRRVLLFLLAVPLFVWQCYPAFDAVAYARSDPSTSPAFYTPLLSYLHAQPGLLGRVEIPMTYRHWESAYAGTSIMLARGWERQLDIAYNPIFYNQPLTSLSYHTWLTTNGVEYVALPHAALDSSSFTEQRLLESPVPYLKPVWSSANWTVWRVTDYSGLVQGQATLSAVSPDRLVLEVTAPGTLKLRFRSSPRWDTNHNGCADATPAGWLVLENVHPGPLILKQSLRGSPCG